MYIGTVGDAKPAKRKHTGNAKDQNIQQEKNSANKLNVF